MYFYVVNGARAKIPRARNRGGKNARDQSINMDVSDFCTFPRTRERNRERGKKERERGARKREVNPPLLKIKEVTMPDFCRRSRWICVSI